MTLKSFTQIRLIQEYKDKTITHITRGFNVIQPIIPMSTDERELFHYIIENITEDKTKYNC